MKAGYGALLIALACAGPAGADPIDEANPKSFRLRPGTRAETKSFAIAELGAGIRLTGKNATPGDKDIAFLSDHGVMLNLSDRYAAGIVIHGEAGSKRGRLGPDLRLRRWFADGHSAVDFQAGAQLVGGESNGVDFRGPAPFVEVSFSASDLMVISAQTQAHGVHLRGDYPHVGGQPPTGVDQDYDDLVTHVSMKLGTVPGRAATVVVAAAFGLVLLAFSGLED